MARPSTLSRDISPPPRRKSSGTPVLANVRKGTLQRDHDGDHTAREPRNADFPKLSAVESGQTQIHDHLDYFVSHFLATIRPENSPGLSIDDFRTLYKRNQHKHGRHFVVHQHDHPISGVHYDLRLQFSDTSTISFAIPYGLPGNPNSVRPNRMAIETRVHTLWNNLIETASHATGSLVIWDTGEYEVLPWKVNKARVTDDDLSGGNLDSSFAGLSQSERLFTCFQRRRIRLRLHGRRLPPNYTLSMWLPSSNDHKGQPKKPKRKRRRVDPTVTTKNEVRTSSDSEFDEDLADQKHGQHVEDDGDEDNAGAASDIDEDSTIHSNNAYPGASNTIGSIHQRNWLLTLDKRNSGFRKTSSESNAARWVGASEAFYVRGRDYERSIVTGRNADEAMADEGVDKFVGRKMWRPILE